MQYHQCSIIEMAALPLLPLMATLRERKQRGEQIIKLYRSRTSDNYSSATDAIADILLYVAATHDESVNILQAAEVDFRNTAEGESFLTEG